jgi:hypothetical protein
VLKSKLEGVDKGHAIAMDGLHQQLQKSLATNTSLEEQLKDQEHLNLKKEKEIEDLRKAAAVFEKRREGFNELLHHFQDNLLGTTSFSYCKVFNFCYAVFDASFLSAMQSPWGKARWIPPRVCARPLMQRRRSLMAFSTLVVRRAGACR